MLEQIAKFFPLYDVPWLYAMQDVRKMVAGEEDEREAAYLLFREIWELGMKEYSEK